MEHSASSSAAFVCEVQVVILLLSAFALVAQNPQAEPRLNYTAAAFPIQRICADLSTQVGVKLRVTDDLANEPLVVRFKDVPLNEALGKIASTVRAEWVRGKEEILLTRPQKLQQKLEEEEYELRLAQVREGIAATRKRLSDQGLLGAAEAQSLVAEFARLENMDPERRNSMAVRQQTAQLNASTPGARFAARIIATLDPEQVANLPEDERIVLSNLPNRMQHPIANWNPAWMDQLVAENNHYVAAMERQMGREKLAESLVRRMEPRGDLKVLADLRAGNINIKIADSDGRIHAFAYLNFLFPDALDRRAKLDEAQRLSRSRPIELNPLTRELTQRIRSATNRDPAAHPPSQAVLQFLQSPEMNDPLSAGFGDILLGYAENEGLNVAAYAPDRTMYWSLVQARTEPVRADVFFAGLDVLRSVDVAINEKWVTIAPVMPLETSRSRTPRNVLGDFIRHVAREGYVSIDSAGRLAIQHKDRQLELARSYLSLLYGTQSNALFSDLDVLRFYGSLSPELKNPAPGKRTLPLSDFNSYQQELIHRLVYRGGYLQDRKNTGEQEAWEEALWSVANDPTEAFPDGLPDETQVSLEFYELGEYLVKQGSGNGGGFEHGNTLGGIAWHYAQMQRTDLYPFMAQQGIMQIWPAEMMEVHITVNPSQRWYVSSLLSENRKTGRGMTVDQFIENLTPEARAVFDEEVRKANEYFKTAPAETYDMGGRPPRPPQ